MAVVLSGCSINQLAVRAVGGMLASGGEGVAFNGDDDPQLVGDALPFALKLYEILLADDPRNPALALATGRGFASYASAFVQTPADQLPSDQYEMQQAMHARAKKLFLRGREYILEALELRHPGFRAALEAKDVKRALSMTNRDDIDYLFWAGASWLGAFGADSFDFDLMVTVPQAVALLTQVLAWDPSYQNGAAQEILISFYGAAPADLGGSEEMARKNFQEAVQYSGGKKAGPYVALASSVSVKKQDATEFRQLLQEALAVNVNASPPDRLENVIQQRRAQWLLDHIDDLFLSAENPSANPRIIGQLGAAAGRNTACASWKSLTRCVRSGRSLSRRVSRD